jgi:adenylate kinase family enzyme
VKYVKALLRAVGKPRNINTIDVATLPIIATWLDEDAPTRIAIVDDLATALDEMRANREVWDDIKSLAWGARYEFTQMVALGKAIDRMIRPKLSLPEATLIKLVRIVAERADCSELRVTAQCEHYAKTQPVSQAFREALLDLSKRFAWNEKLVARIAWIAAEAQPARVKKT